MTSIKEKRDNMLWVEKYRPKRLHDIFGQEQVIQVLQKTLETGEMPHLLFYGSPGTGKTSTILAAAMQLFGYNRIDERVKVLNASDERGIGIVRNDINTFCKIAIGSVDPNYPSPPFKIIILDEACAMTAEAQAALRKVMEKNSHISKFCIICNYSEKIIEPIKSRCMKFRFNPLNDNLIISKLTQITQKENMTINLACLKQIATISEGDARRAIATLQNLKYMIDCNHTITPTYIVNMTGGISDQKIKTIMAKCMSGSVNDIVGIVQNIYRNGYQVSTILAMLNEHIIQSKLSDISKSKIITELCNTDTKLMDCGDERLQLLNIFVLINQVAKEDNK